MRLEDIKNIKDDDERYDAYLAFGFHKNAKYDKSKKISITYYGSICYKDIDAKFDKNKYIRQRYYRSIAYKDVDAKTDSYSGIREEYQIAKNIREKYRKVSIELTQEQLEQVKE